MTSLQKWGKSVRTTIPVMAGYLVLGAGFGILLRTRGYGLGWALAMSAFIYAGSMQYVAIDLLTGGASLLTTAVTTLLVNARHLFYGISMLERYRAAGKFAPYLIFSLTDETYSLVAAREDLTGAECFRISLLDQLYWVLGTALGSLAGAYLLWMGLINVASEAGLIEKLAARMHKPLRLLMPDAGDASASVTLNLAANFFGLGNAATPFGLDAMKRLNAVNPDKQSASNAICMFLALNASAIELMPTGVIAVRIACGSANAYDIVLPTFISSVFSAAAAILACKFFESGAGVK